MSSINLVNHQPLPRISPEAAGIASQTVSRFVSQLAKAGLQPHSFMLVRHGKVAAEGYYHPYGPLSPQTIYSLSKSFTSAAIGMAAADDLIGLDDKLVDLFPDDLPGECGPELGTLTIRHCLQMATGQPEEPSFADPNPIRAFLAMPFSEMPGQVFRYNTAATYMLSAALHQKGIDLEAFLQQRLFDPLGVGPIRWMRCPLGICTGGFGMSAIPELIAKFGLLILQKGSWQGKQLIDAAYLAEATACRIATKNDDPANQDKAGDWALGYGYQFWQARGGSFRGDGMYGQFCLILPDQDLVLAMTAFNDDMQKQLDIFFDTIVSNLSASALPENPAEQQRLQAVLADLKINWPPAADEGQELDDRFMNGCYCFQVEQEESLFAPPALRSLKLEKAGTDLLLTLDPLQLRLQDKAWQLHELPLFSLLRWPTTLLTSYGTSGRNQLNVRLFWLEMLSKFELQFCFQDDQVTVTILDIHAEKPEVVMTCQGQLEPKQQEAQDA